MVGIWQWNRRRTTDRASAGVLTAPLADRATSRIEAAATIATARAGRPDRRGRGRNVRTTTGRRPSRHRGCPTTSIPASWTPTSGVTCAACARRSPRRSPCILVAAGTLLEEDPKQALQHARYARRRASRIAAVREAAGIAAYRAGEWSEALAELRAARRMGGGPGHLAVMADIERALGRPERALELARSPEASDLPGADAVELIIVAAGARRDLGDVNAAVSALEIGELDPAKRSEWSPRLFYAYADNLLAAGRRDEAISWFLHAADADDDELTDAAERLAELTGETPEP